MLLLQREDIERVFSMKDAIEADKEAFSLASAQKAVMPLRTTLSATDGTLCRRIKVRGFKNSKRVSRKC